MERHLLEADQMRLAAKDFKKLQKGNPIIIITRQGHFINRLKEANKLTFSSSIGFRVYVDQYMNAHPDLNMVDATRRAKCFYRRFSEEQRNFYRQQVPGYRKSVAEVISSSSSSSFATTTDSGTDDQYENQYPAKGPSMTSPKTQQRISNRNSNSSSSNNKFANTSSATSSQATEGTETSNTSEGSNASQNYKTDAKPSSSAETSREYHNSNGTSSAAAAAATTTNNGTHELTGSAEPPAQLTTPNQDTTIDCDVDSDSGDCDSTQMPSDCGRFSHTNVGFSNFYRHYLFYNPQHLKRQGMRKAAEIYATFDSNRRLKYEALGPYVDFVPMTESGRPVVLDEE